MKEEAQKPRPSGRGVVTIPIDPQPKGKRGFACMSAEKRSAISRLGGMSVPAEKRAFSVDRDVAAKAGRRGGFAKKKAATI